MAKKTIYVCLTCGNGWIPDVNDKKTLEKLLSSGVTFGGKKKCPDCIEKDKTLNGTI